DMPFGGDPAGGDEIHRDLPGGQLVGPRAGESKLRAFGGGVVGEFRHAALEDFRTDVDDPAVMALFHLRHDSFGQEHGRFDEEFELIEADAPGKVFDFDERLRAGGVDDQDVDEAEARLDIVDQSADFG